MSERKYEHTLDMDQLLDIAARYEQAVVEGQHRMWEGNDKTALHKAIDALELARDMFYLALPEDVRNEFQDALTERVLNERADA